MRKRLLVLLNISLLLAACGDLKPEPTPEQVGPMVQAKISMQNAFVPANDDKNSPENLVNSLTGYLFEGEKLVKIVNDLPLNATSVDLELPKAIGNNNYFYLLANATQIEALKGVVEGGIARAHFLTLQGAVQGKALPDNLVLSGGGKVDSEELQNFIIKMNRGMARVDLAVKTPEIAVNRITIYNTQNENFVFAQAAVKGATYVNVTCDFPMPVTTNIPGVAYINEQRNSRLYARVECTYRGLNEIITLELPTIIDRNAAYQIILQRSTDPIPPVDPPVDPPVTPDTPVDPPVTPDTPVDPPVTPDPPVDPPVTPDPPVDPPVTPDPPVDPPVTPDPPVDPPVTPDPPVDPPVTPDPPKPKPDKAVGFVRTIFWYQGGDETATPDLRDRIQIDTKKTVTPANIKLNLETSTLDFPRNGGEATIWFTGNHDKEFEIVSADARLTITPLNDMFKNSGVMLKAVQPISGVEFVVKIRVKKSYILNDPGLELTVKVANHELEHVIMGGLKWMMCNAIGSEPALYPFLQDGQSVRDFYKQNWKTHTAMTVWGPRPNPGPHLWPWESAITKNNNGGGPIVGDALGMEWVAAHNNFPCPKGWRLPSIAEFNRIWPVGSANQEYTNGGVKYTCSIENSGHPEFLLDGTTRTAPTKIFVISNGKQDLIFPIAGWRRAGVTVKEHAAEIGNYLNLWTAHRGASVPNSASTIGIRNGAAYFSSVGGNVDWTMADAYKNARCVKSLQ